MLKIHCSYWHIFSFLDTTQVIPSSQFSFYSPFLLVLRRPSSHLSIRSLIPFLERLKFLWTSTKSISRPVITFLVNVTQLLDKVSREGRVLTAAIREDVREDGEKIGRSERRIFGQTGSSVSQRSRTTEIDGEVERTDKGKREKRAEYKEDQRTEQTKEWTPAPWKSFIGPFSRPKSQQSSPKSPEQSPKPQHNSPNSSEQSPKLQQNSPKSEFPPARTSTTKDAYQLALNETQMRKKIERQQHRNFKSYDSHHQHSNYVQQRTSVPSSGGVLKTTGGDELRRKSSGVLRANTVPMKYVENAQHCRAPSKSMMSQMSHPMSQVSHSMSQMSHPMPTSMSQTLSPEERLDISQSSFHEQSPGQLYFRH